MTHYKPEDQIIEQMAETILEIIEEHGRCTIRDLRSKGYSLDEITRNWPKACALAEAKKDKPWYGRK